MSSPRDLENGNGGMQDQNRLQKIETEDQLRNALSQQLTISPELFERMFLSPETKVAGDLRKTFANPTPIAVLGFTVGLFPLSIEFMNWRGSGGTFGTPTTTCSIWFGGLLLIVGGIGEFILGNTFPFVVFFGYGAHFLTYATTFMPYFSAVEWNSTTPGDGFKPGPVFAAGFGFYPVALAMLSFVFFLCSLRTNLVFVLLFACATAGFSCAARSLFLSAQGQMTASASYLVATGGCFFAADMLGWYLLLSIMIAVMELPIPDLPVFDLSTAIPAKSRLRMRKEEKNA